MSKIIGIDLGTTNSCVAIMEGGSPKVIYSAEGRNVFPSVVDPIKNIVGDVAKRQMVIHAKSTVYSVKRLMGRKNSDKSVDLDKKLLPYEIKGGKNDMAVVVVEGKEFTPQEISAKILAKIKTDVEKYLGESVKQAVITVPAYFDDSQRQATKQAGEIAGLEVMRILNEPTAAALAYGLDKKNAHTIAVYDLGGGTFDISILELGEGVYEVKATNGDTHLGGDDFDKRILDYLADEFKKEHGVDLRKDPQALQRIRDAAEKAKIELSSSLETEINLPFVSADVSGPKHLSLKLTRAKFEALVGDLLERLVGPCKECMKDADLSREQIDEVILVGGMTRVPKVQEKVREIFGKEPSKGVNPDEVVAVGAAVQGGVLKGEVKDVLLLDVTPLSLGIETLGGVSTKLIEKNTTIPTRKSQVFSTAADNQTAVTIHVLQGEREFANDNKSLGRFDLVGLPPAPRGIPQIEVSFDIDANGLVHVSAKDRGTGKEQSIRITASSGLNEQEIKRMQREAEAHHAEDERKREIVLARNNLDGLIYIIEKTLREQSQKIDVSIRAQTEEAVSDAKKHLDSQDVNELKRVTDQLTAASNRMSEQLYAAGKGPEEGVGPGMRTDKKEKEEDVIDAEYKKSS